MRILLIEDHPIVRDACRRILQDHSELEMLEAGTGAEGLALCRQAGPEVVILDLQLPDIKGLDALRELRVHVPGIKVVVFTMYEDAAFVVQAFDAGAMAYVTKTDDPEALLAAIDAVGRGAVYLGPAVAEKVALSRLRTEPDPVGTLSPREADIFACFGEGLGFTEIASRLNISYKTVANVSTRIKEKIGVTTTAALVKAAVERTQTRIAAGSPPGGRLTTSSSSLDS